MANPESDPQRKQTTQKGLEIPVPTREDFLRDMDKAAPKPEPAEDESPKKG